MCALPVETLPRCASPVEELIDLLVVMQQPVTKHVTGAAMLAGPLWCSRLQSSRCIVGLMD